MNFNEYDQPFEGTGGLSEEDRNLALCYVLNDPSLDRAAFEQRLGSNLQLAEYVGQTVETLERVALRNEPKSSRNATVPQAAFSTEVTDRFTERSSQHREPNRRKGILVLIGALAAMLLLFVSMQKVKERSQLSSIAKTWTELQQEEETLQVALEEESLIDATSSDAIPEWLVFATEASVDIGLVGNVH